MANFRMRPLARPPGATTSSTADYFSGSVETDDRDLAVGLLLISAIARRDRRDLGQRGLTFLTLQERRTHFDLAVPDLQPDTVRVFGQVDEPVRVGRRTAV